MIITKYLAHFLSHLSIQPIYSLLLYLLLVVVVTLKKCVKYLEVALSNELIASYINFYTVYPNKRTN